MNKLSLHIFNLCVLLLTLSSQSKEKLTMEQVLKDAKPYSGVYSRGVDTKTLNGKVMCGYQGWFSTKGDGSNRGWEHYGHKDFGPGKCTIDLWPDLSEFSKNEKYKTNFKHKDGSPAYAFSSYNKATVIRHFKWMKDYGIDGVFLQRFGSTVKSVSGLNKRNKVTQHVQAGANQHGRTWANMYDLSGMKKGELKSVIMKDWKMLVDRMKILKDQSYLHHEGKPVISIWGIGFKDRQYSLTECKELVEFFKNDPKYGGLTVMLGIPAYWRELHRDSVSDRTLHEIIAMADIISPWTVGRFANKKGIDSYAKVAAKDIQWSQLKKIDFLPVIFPGFSWQNLKRARGEDVKLNQIPRQKGRFLWDQAAAQVQNEVRMIYIAMFDEIDEATAIFKCTNNPPIGASHFINYEGLPSDHYLWLSGKIKELLNREIKEEMPFRK
jgi:hypothetical protein